MKRIFLGLFCTLSLLACTDEMEDLSSKVDMTPVARSVVENMDTETAQKEFAKILSKAIYNNIALRQFLKDEAIKQFDNDYDIFYPLVKGKIVVAEKTFYDILLDYSSKEELASIEKAVLC